MKRFIICMFLVPVTVWSQYTGKISGVVRDAKTGESLIGANVLVKGTKLGATSDIDGNYFILNISPGEYDVAASFMGYQTVTQKNVIVNTSRTTELNFGLQPATLELGHDIVISADRPDVVKEKTSTSEIMRAEEVTSVAGIQNVSDMLSLSSDISDGHFRGGREGEELYNLQGMGIVNPLYSTSSFSPIVSAIEEVEVITSGFSAQYGNAQSGVVNITMKEGRSDRWVARAEVRTRLPGRKHFGPSVWDSAANPYLRMFDSPAKWLGMDSSGTNPQRYFSTIGNGFDSRYGKDTITLSEIVYTLWSKQGRRDIGKSYDNLWDYSFDVTVGGPLSEDARVFIALHNENTWAMLPTPDPDQKQQIMGNLVLDVGPGMALRFSGALSNQREYYFRGRKTTGFYNWVWDRVLATSRTLDETMQYGVKFTHALNNSTFYELKLSMLQTDDKLGAPVINPESIYNGDWGKTIWIPYGQVPDFFYFGNFDDDFTHEKTKTISIDGSVTSQVTMSHMLVAGIQGNWYDINTNNHGSMKSSNGQRFEQYVAKPFELGLFAQDKMEFEGMIANVGLRFDVWNQNVFYYEDQYSPYRFYTSDSSYIIDKTLAPRVQTPTLYRLQPRIGISFPASVSTVFHMNYGSFVQRPPFSQTIFSQVPASGYSTMIIGNPRLKPQVTNNYDVGVTQGLGEGFTLDISGYYKDVKDLIQQAFFVDSAQVMYSSFMNRDYADIRGFRVGFAKRRGIITGSINYTYGVATGKNATPFNASPYYREKPAAGQSSVDLPSPKDIVLDFDRTHNLIANVTINTGEEWGPDLFDAYPLERFTVAITSFARSGRPYTYDTQGLGELNNHRTPGEYNTNLKITRQFRNLFGLSATFYLEVINLFDQKIYSYSAVFANTRSSSTGTITENRNIAKFENDPASLQYYENTNNPEMLADQTFMIYDNAPRSFNVGIIFNF
jgi:outer membrane receptor protein involved in Fe transport